MPNADTRAVFAVTDTLNPHTHTHPVCSPSLGRVLDSAAATSRCIIINVRTNEAGVAVKYDEDRPGRTCACPQLRLHLQPNLSA